MDLAGGVERGASRVHGPGAHLVLAHGEEGLEAEQPVAGVDQAAEPGLRDPGAREVFAPLPPRQLCRLGLVLRGTRHALRFLVMRLPGGAQLVAPPASARRQTLPAYVRRVQE